jgi:peroxiredoxin
MRRASFGALLMGLVACNRAAPSQGDAHTSSTLASASAPAAAPAPEHAEIGKPAPDFTLKDLDGKAWSMRDLRGKTVVLEWFNPECPFVRMAHTKGSLVGTAKRHEAEGVVWLAVNSAAPGKQGAGAEKSADGKKRYGLDHPILLDESGDVGRAYGATNTPHMFVIDREGVLRYAGAIDNSPDGEGESPTDGKLVRYVDEALASIAAGRPVLVTQTRAYGCGVKYGH